MNFRIIGYSADGRPSCGLRNNHPYGEESFPREPSGPGSLVRFIEREGCWLILAQPALSRVENCEVEMAAAIEDTLKITRSYNTAL